MLFRDKLRVESIKSDFGLYSDEEIAKRHGISKSTVRIYRQEMGVSPVKKWDSYMNLLGVAPDSVVAEKMGITANAVAKKRLRLGINSTTTQEEFLFQCDFVNTLLGYEEYVRTPYGIIDVLDSDTIYELKTVLDTSSAQKAIGQLFTYRFAYPSLEIAIVTKEVKVKAPLLKAIEELGIRVIVHHMN